MNLSRDDTQNPSISFICYYRETLIGFIFFLRLYKILPIEKRLLETGDKNFN